MTELIEPPTMQLQLAPRPIGQVLATGLFGGVLLGVVARAWMRLSPQCERWRMIRFSMRGKARFLQALVRTRWTRLSWTERH